MTTRRDQETARNKIIDNTPDNNQINEEVDQNNAILTAEPGKGIQNDAKGITNGL